MMATAPQPNTSTPAITPKAMRVRPNWWWWSIVNHSRRRSLPVVEPDIEADCEAAAEVGTAEAAGFAAVADPDVDPVPVDRELVDDCPGAEHR